MIVKFCDAYDHAFWYYLRNFRVMRLLYHFAAGWVGSFSPSLLIAADLFVRFGGDFNSVKDLKALNFDWAHAIII